MTEFPGGRREDDIVALAHTGVMETRLVSVSRTESATGWWEFARAGLDVRTRDLVTGICGYRERSDGPLRRRVAAGTSVPLIVSFGDPIEIVDMGEGAGAGRAYESFVSGFHPGYAVTRYQGTQFGMQIDLTPLGAYRLLGVPGSTLASRVVSLDDVVPALAGSLPDQLASRRTWPERIALLDDVLAGLLDRGPQPDPLVTWMWSQLKASNGQARISELVADTGRSHRYVTSRFRDQVGATPKTVARVVRFEAATKAVTSGQPLASVAAACGYADQSHLTREFVRLGGCTPAAMADSTVS